MEICATDCSAGEADDDVERVDDGGDGTSLTLTENELPFHCSTFDFWILRSAMTTGC